MTPERRHADVPFDRRKYDPLLRGLLLAVVLAFLAWAAKPLIPVTVVRFEADSISRDKDNARRDSTLNRIDARVGAIYCAQVDERLRAGCR